MSWLGAWFYDWGMAGPERRFAAGWRRELLAGVAGDVLEIGAGTGANLAHYPAAVDHLVVTEPDRHMRARLLERAPRELEVVDARAEKLPFADASFDVVVGTLVLCSVRDPAASLAELRRVLRPGGRLVYYEHVASVNARTRRYQELAQPVWRRLAGNCHLARPTGELIEAAGFLPESMRREPMPGANVLVAETIRGVARRG